VTARPLARILQASNSARMPVSEKEQGGGLIHRFPVHKIGGTEEGSAHHGEREGAIDWSEVRRSR
jgi:hypothetical protein